MQEAQAWLTNQESIVVSKSLWNNSFGNYKGWSRKLVKKLYTLYLLPLALGTSIFFFLHFALTGKVMEVNKIAPYNIGSCKLRGKRTVIEEGIIVKGNACLQHTLFFCNFQHLKFCRFRGILICNEVFLYNLIMNSSFHCFSHFLWYFYKQPHRQHSHEACSSRRDGLQLKTKGTLRAINSSWATFENIKNKRVNYTLLVFSVFLAQFMVYQQFVHAMPRKNKLPIWSIYEGYQ